MICMENTMVQVLFYINVLCTFMMLQETNMTVSLQDNRALEGCNVLANLSLCLW